MNDLIFDYVKMKHGVSVDRSREVISLLVDFSLHMMIGDLENTGVCESHAKEVIEGFYLERIEEAFSEGYED